MVYDNWSSDEEVTRYVTWPAHKDIITTKRILMDWQLYYQSPNAYQWAIVDRETDEVIGSISLYEFHRKGLVINAS